MKPPRLSAVASLAFAPKSFALITLACVFAAGHASAASATWRIDPATGNWVPGTGVTNWGSAGSYAGTAGASAYTSTDVATFNNASAITSIVINDSSLNLGGILFDGSASAFTIGSNGGNALYLTAPTTAATTSSIRLGTNGTSFTGSGTTQTIAAPIVLSPSSATANGTYSFTNNSTTASNRLLFTGGISAGTTTGTVTLTLGGANTGSNEISGIISDGSGKIAISKTGAGSWTLSGANTFSGGLTLATTGSTLNINNASALGTGTFATLGASGTVTIDNTSGAAITLSTNNTVTLNQGALVFTGSNNLDFGSGSATYAGSRVITVNAGTLRFGQLVNGAATAGVGVTVNGAGTLVLGGFALSNVTTARTAILSGSGNIEITGAITDSTTGTPASGLTYQGTGVLTLTGTSTYQGITTISNGTVTVTGGGRFAGTTGGTALNLTGGTLNLNNADAYAPQSAKTLNVTGGTLNIGATNAISDLAALTLNTGASYTLNTGLDYSGTTTLTSTVLIAGAANVLSPNSTIALTDAATSGLVLNGLSQSIGGLSSGTITNNAHGSVNLGSGAVTLTVGGNGATTTYNGVISSTGGAGNTGNLTKIGTGQLSLTGVNTYNGLTTVSGGTLRIANATGSAISNTSGILITDGAMIFAGDLTDIIPDGVTITMTGGVFNGTLGTNGTALLDDTFAALNVSGSGFYNTGGGDITITGMATFTGTGGNASGVIGSSSQSFFNGLTLTGMTATTAGAAPYNGGDMFALFGNNSTTQTLFTVGSGGLHMSGSNLLLRRGGTNAKGSLLALEGNVSVTGSSASNIMLDTDSTSANGTGTVGLNLASSTTSAVTRDFTVGAGASLSVSVAVGNGTSSAAGINKLGAGTLTLSGVNTFTGGITLSEGTLQLGSTTALGAATGRLTILGGSLDSSVSGLVLSGNSPLTFGGDFGFAGTQSLNLGTGAVSLGAAAGPSRTINVAANTLIVGGVISNGTDATTPANSLVKSGAGTLVLSNSANTFTGGVTLNAGTLRIGGAGSLGTVAGTLTLRGGTLETLSSTAITTNNYALVIDGNFGLAGPGNLNLGTGGVSLGASAGTERTINVAANTLTIGGAISNGTTASGIIKTGAGTLALTGTSTFDGAVRVREGTLSVVSLGASSNGSLGSAAATGNIELGSTGTTGVLEYTGAGTTGVNARGFSFAAGGTGELRVTNATSIGTFNGGITGSGNLVKSGAGTLALGGNNAGAFTGSITVSAGALEFTTAASLPYALDATNTTVQSGGTLAFGVGGTSGFTASQVLANTGFGTATGGMLSGSFVGFDPTNAASGTFVFNGGLADTNGGANSIGLSKIGSAASNLVLSGANSYTGVTNILGGIVTVQHAAAFGSAAAGIVIAPGAAIQLQGGITVSGETISTTASASGGSNPNFLTSASGNNVWNGSITGAVGGGSENFRISASTGSSLTVNGSITGTGSFVNTGTSGTGLVISGGGTTTVNGVISGNMEVISTTTTGSGTAVLTAMNSYTGATRLQSGTVEVKSIGLQGVAGGLGAGTGTASQIIFGQGSTTGTLRYTGAGDDTTDRPVVFGTGGTSGASATGTIEASGGGLMKFQGTFSASTGSKILALAGTTRGEFASVINNGTSGTVAVSKSGGGTWTLSGTNTYTGTTSVSAGTLVINGDNSLATGAVTVASGATLGGSGTVGGATTISGIHAPGNSPGTQTFNSSLTYATGSTFSWELASATTAGPGINFDSVVVNGALTINDANFRINVSNLNLNSAFWAMDRTWSVFDADSTTGNFFQFVLYDTSDVGSGPVDYSEYGSFSFTPATGSLSWSSAVPEPTNALAGVLITAGLLRRRRQHR